MIKNLMFAVALMFVVSPAFAGSCPAKVGRLMRPFHQELPKTLNRSKCFVIKGKLNINQVSTVIPSPLLLKP